jgi:CxxC motif-containing protein (DUF1111 family)
MKKIFPVYKIAAILSLIALVSCEATYSDIPAEDSILDGTIEGLSSEESARFLKGDEAFHEIFTSKTGLGPIFVATSCISCHAGDGKGHPFTTLTRFGQIDETGNLFLNQGGPQLQSRALPGHLPEQIPAGATFARFTPPANTGLGFLQFVTDTDIIAMSDPDDSDNDGISGTPNWIEIPDFVTPLSTAISLNGKYIGRYGKKAAVHNLLQQTANAYNQDMGITSIFLPIDSYTHLEIDPEIVTATVNNVAFYLQTLKAPIQRNPDDAIVKQGATIFEQINCTGCHKSELKTGHSLIHALSNKTFAPYTDLLLHDMGSELDDHYTEGSAKTFEWRTSPLWGIGLAQDSQGGNLFLMHDGRARSIEDAIMMHGGEGIKSKNNFNTLSKTDKEAVLKFIRSL